MIQVIPELVEVSGRMRVKITVRDGDKVLDADMVDPFNAAQRRKVAERLAGKPSDPELLNKIELAVLNCVARRDESADAEDVAEEVLNGRNVWMVRPELIVVPGVVGVSVPETVIRGKDIR